jgi:hypothetical protein
VEASLNNPSKYASKWAFIYIAAAILNTVLDQVLKVDPNSYIRVFGYTIPFILFLILTQIEYRRSIGGYITFQQTFSAGVRYAVYSGLLFGILIFVNLSFFSNEIQQSIAATRASLAAKGVSKEQIDKQLEVGQNHGALIIAFFAAIQTTILGLIISAIGAAILKKEATK